MFKAGDIVMLRAGATIKECLSKVSYKAIRSVEVEVICSAEHVTTVVLPGNGKAAEVGTGWLIQMRNSLIGPDFGLASSRRKWSAEESEGIRKGLKALSIAYATAMNRSVASIEWEMYRALKEKGCKG